jgi:hypothetical protein
MIKAFHNTRLITLLVIPDTDEPIHNDQTSRNKRCDQHYNKTGGISRRVLGLEGQRADKVS